MSTFRKNSSQPQRDAGAGGDEYQVDGVEVPVSDIDLGTIDESAAAEAEVMPAGSGGRRSGGTATLGPVVARHGAEQRRGSFQFLHEVNVEMRKVAWPTRTETINYSSVVLVTLAVLMALIFGLDLGFSKLAFDLFK